MNVSMRRSFVGVIFVVAVAAIALAFVGTAKAELIGHWTFDDPDDRYNDSSDYGYDGTNYVNVGSGAKFEAQTYSVSAWLNVADLGAYRVAVGSWNGGDRWMHFGRHNGNYYKNAVDIDGTVQSINDPSTANKDRNRSRHLRIGAA